MPARYRKIGRRRCRSLADAAERKATCSAQIGEDMVALKGKMDREKRSDSQKGPGKSAKAKFGVFGEEMIEKEVKPSGNSGRVYLPLEWVGKHVKIIRID